MSVFTPDLSQKAEKRYNVSFYFAYGIFFCHHAEHSYSLDCQRFQVSMTSGLGGFFLALKHVLTQFIKIFPFLCP